MISVLEAKLFPEEQADAVVGHCTSNTIHRLNWRLFNVSRCDLIDPIAVSRPNDNCQVLTEICNTACITSDIKAYLTFRRSARHSHELKSRADMKYTGNEPLLGVLGEFSGLDLEHET